MLFRTDYLICFCLERTFAWGVLLLGTCFLLGSHIERFYCKCTPSAKRKRELENNMENDLRIKLVNERGYDIDIHFVLL